MGTIDDGIGRRGDVCAQTPDQGDVLARAQRLFAGLANRLEQELDTLQFEDFEAVDDKTYAKVQALAKENQRALMFVLEQQAKLAQLQGARREGELDLDAARREVEDRLARLAA